MTDMEREPMTDDIVDRLRFGSLTYEGASKMNLEAAYEIEKLRLGTEIAAANGICPVCGKGTDNA